MIIILSVLTLILTYYGVQTQYHIVLHAIVYYVDSHKGWYIIHEYELVITELNVLSISRCLCVKS